MSARFSYLSHLECSECQRSYDAGQLQNVSQCCSRPLLAVYDLEALARDMAPGELAGREASMWRYHELLPVRDERFVLTLGEGMTPLLAAPRLASTGLERGARVLIKDEGQNPTGSFKARGMAAAVSRAVELGAGGLVTPTAGNAGAAMVAYAARAGVPGYVTAPEDAPDTCIKQACLYGAEVELVEGLISDAGRVAARVAQQRGWFSVATLREPYRVEGKKTMGLELAARFLEPEMATVLFFTGSGLPDIGKFV
jgi:threonine synthase